MTSSNTRVILLGTGNPNPDPKRSGCSTLILVEEVPYIIDFGAGVVRQVATLTSKYGGPVKDLDVKDLSVAFLTHLHSDHTIGYPDLILTPWVMERERPLEVYGPEGIVEMTEHVLNAYQEDIKYRLYGLEPANDQGWRVNAHEIKEGIIYQDEHLLAEAFPVKHGSWPNAFGFRFTSDDKVIVISGDTAPCENVIKYSQGADILIHEVYFQKALEESNSFWKNYHSINHTSTYELAEIASRAKPKLLILYHVLFWGGTQEDILDEIAQGYDGEVVIGTDLQEFE